LQKPKSFQDEFEYQSARTGAPFDSMREGQAVVLEKG
jgi:hypothetical protein